MSTDLRTLAAQYRLNLRCYCSQGGGFIMFYAGKPFALHTAPTAQCFAPGVFAVPEEGEIMISVGCDRAGHARAWLEAETVPPPEPILGTIRAQEGASRAKAGPGQD